jgi:hypothetical protein
MVAGVGHDVKANISENSSSLARILVLAPIADTAMQLWFAGVGQGHLELPENDGCLAKERLNQLEVSLANVFDDLDICDG